MSKETISTEEAMSVLREALENEDYRRSWQANIAMAFKDTIAQYREEENKKGRLSKEDLHIISNRAAIHFLTILTKS